MPSVSPQPHDQIANHFLRIRNHATATTFRAARKSAFAAWAEVTQELGILSLIKLGVRVITASGDELTDSSDPMKVAMRQIAGAFAQLEKARLVAKLKGARERKRATGVKVEGRKTYAEMENGAELIAATRRLNDGRSLRAISAALAEQGFTTRTGKPYSASGVKDILAGESNSAALKRTTARGKRILAA